MSGGKVSGGKVSGGKMSGGKVSHYHHILQVQLAIHICGFIYYNAL